MEVPSSPLRSTVASSSDGAVLPRVSQRLVNAAEVSPAQQAKADDAGDAPDMGSDRKRKATSSPALRQPKRLPGKVPVVSGRGRAQSSCAPSGAKFGQAKLPGSGKATAKPPPIKRAAPPAAARTAKATKLAAGRDSVYMKTQANKLSAVQASLAQARQQAHRVAAEHKAAEASRRKERDSAIKVALATAQSAQEKIQQKEAADNKLKAATRDDREDAAAEQKLERAHRVRLIEQRHRDEEQRTAAQRAAEQQQELAARQRVAAMELEAFNASRAQASSDQRLNTEQRARHEMTSVAATAATAAQIEQAANLQALQGASAGRLQAISCIQQEGLVLDGNQDRKERDGLHRAEMARVRETEAATRTSMLLSRQQHEQKLEMNAAEGELRRAEREAAREARQSVYAPEVGDDEQ